MKTKILTFIICFTALFSSCKKDGEIIKLTGLESAELLVSDSTVVLTKETSANTVLALTWNASNLTISNSSMGVASSLPLAVIEASSTVTFDTIIEVTPDTLIYTFLGAPLNTLGKNLGFKAGISSPLYFRVKKSLGANATPTYSNVVRINLTCYSIDMSKGFILDKDKGDTGFKLYSPNSDGEYSGFTGVGAWYNWLLLEGDGTIWGTYNSNEVGEEFVLDNNETTQWKLWYPALIGCYYTTVSTTKKEWTATHIQSLKVSGDIDSYMTFDKAAVKWFVSFTTTSSNAKVKVSCAEAKLFNKTSKTDSTAVTVKSLGFIPTSDSTLTIDWKSSSAGDITIPTAGEYTLTFYLADPTHWTYQIKSGITIIEKPLSKKLFLPGISEGTGSWTFNNYLKLINADDSTYGGAVLVNSSYGYEMTLDSMEWVNVYQKGATDGTLAYKSGTNIPSPGSGLYLIKADLKKLTYSHTAITGLSYTGLNGDWGVTSMTEMSVKGVYASTVTINSTSQYGFQFYVNGSWEMPYGGINGVLNYAGANITEDTIIGTNDLIANIIDNSYVFLGDKIYISGINDDWGEGANMTLSKTSIGIYSGTINVTKTSTYGITIQLDKSWKRFYGGSFSSLKYQGSNITDDQSLAIGTYNVTVDLIHGTCSFATK